MEDNENLTINISGGLLSPSEYTYLPQFRDLSTKKKATIPNWQQQIINNRLSTSKSIPLSIYINENTMALLKIGFLRKKDRVNIKEFLAIMMHSLDFSGEGLKSADSFMSSDDRGKRFSFKNIDDDDTPVVSLFDEYLVRESYDEEDIDNFDFYELFMETEGSLNGSAYEDVSRSIAEDQGPFMSSPSISKRSSSQLSPAQTSKSKKKQISELCISIFDKSDKDVDGYISWNDFSPVLLECANSTLHEADVRQLQKTAVQYDPANMYIKAIHRTRYLPHLSALAIMYSNNPGIYLFSLKTGEVFAPPLEYAKACPLDICYSPQLDTCISSSTDKNLTYWTLGETGKKDDIDAMYIPSRMKCRVSVPFTVDHLLAFSGSLNPSSFLTSSPFATPLVSSQSYDHLLLGGTGGEVALFRTDAMKYSLLRTTPELFHDTPITALENTYEGQQILSGDQEGKVLLWNLETESPLFALPKQDKKISSLHVSPSLRCVFTASLHRSIKVWNLFVHGAPIFSLKGHVRAVVSVSSIEGTSYVVSTDSEGLMKIWDLRTLQCVQSVSTRSRVVDCLSLEVANDEGLVIHTMESHVSSYKIQKGASGEKSEERADHGERAVKGGRAEKGELGKEVLGVGYDKMNYELVFLKNKEVQRYDAEMGEYKKKTSYSLQTEITFAYTDKMRNRYIIGDTTGRIVVYSCFGMETLFELTGHEVDISAILSTPMYIISACWKGKVLVHAEKNKEEQDGGERIDYAREEGQGSRNNSVMGRRGEALDEGYDSEIESKNKKAERAERKRGGVGSKNTIIRFEFATTLLGVTCLTYSFDQEILFAASGMEVFAFCLRSFRRLHVFSSFAQRITSLSFQDDLGILAVGDMTGVLSLWTTPKTIQNVGRNLLSRMEAAKVEFKMLTERGEEKKVEGGDEREGDIRKGGEQEGERRIEEEKWERTVENNIMIHLASVLIASTSEQKQLSPGDPENTYRKSDKQAKGLHSIQRQKTLRQPSESFSQSNTNPLTLHPLLDMEWQCLYSWEAIPHFNELFIKNRSHEGYGIGVSQESPYHFKYYRRAHLEKGEVDEINPGGQNKHDKQDGKFEEESYVGSILAYPISYVSFIPRDVIEEHSSIKRFHSLSESIPSSSHNFSHTVSLKEEEKEALSDVAHNHIFETPSKYWLYSGDNEGNIFQWDITSVMQHFLIIPSSPPKPPSSQTKPSNSALFSTPSSSYPTLPILDQPMHAAKKMLWAVLEEHSSYVLPYQQKRLSLLTLSPVKLLNQEKQEKKQIKSAQFLTFDASKNQTSVVLIATGPQGASFWSPFLDFYGTPSNNSRWKLPMSTEAAKARRVEEIKRSILNPVTALPLENSSPGLDIQKTEKNTMSQSLFFPKKRLSKEKLLEGVERIVQRNPPNSIAVDKQSRKEEAKRKTKVASRTPSTKVIALRHLQTMHLSKEELDAEKKLNDILERAKTFEKGY